MRRWLARSARPAPAPRRLTRACRGPPMRLRRCQPRTDTRRHVARLRLSVLDDNRCLSLPTGERLRIHRKLTIVFECRNLAHASAASVSRCGVVWLGGESAPLSALLSHARWRIDRAMRDGASRGCAAPAAPDLVRGGVRSIYAGGCGDGRGSLSRRRSTSCRSLHPRQCTQPERSRRASRPRRARRTARL